MWTDPVLQILRALKDSSLRSETTFNGVNDAHEPCELCRKQEKPTRPELAFIALVTKKIIEQLLQQQA